MDENTNTEREAFEQWRSDQPYQGATQLQKEAFLAGFRAAMKADATCAPVAEIGSAAGDDAAFGGRAIYPLMDIDGFEYGTKLYTRASLSLPAAGQEPVATAAHIAAMERAWLWMENQADGQSKGGHATFDLMMLREERDALRAAIDMEVAVKSCPHCDGTGEVFGHAENCSNDLCALNGDMHSCAGKVEPCQCATRAAPQPAASVAGQEPVARVNDDGFIVETGLLLSPGMKLYAAPQPAVAAGWMPIATAPEGQLVAVGWLDREDTEHPERFEFDYLEDGCWMQWHEHAEHVEVIGGHGVSYTPPYTHWMPLGTLPPAPSTEGESNG